MSNVHVPPAGGQSLPSPSSSPTPSPAPSPAPSPTPSLAAGKPSGEPVDLPPQLAILSDGTVLLSTADAEAFGRDLTGRTLWTGFALTLDDIALLRENAYDVEQYTAAKVIARLPKKPNSGA